MLKHFKLTKLQKFYMVLLSIVIASFWFLQIGMQAPKEQQVEFIMNIVFLTISAFIAFWVINFYDSNKAKRKLKKNVQV